MARSSSKVSTGVLSVPSRCPSWGRVQPHHWTHCKLFPSAPLPKLSFTLGCCGQSERLRHLHKNFLSTLGTCPVEATTSSISTPQDARHHRANTQHPPPTAAISTISRTPPLDAHIDHSTVRQRDQHPVPGRVGLTIELPHHRAQAAHPPFDQAEQAIDRLLSYISPSPLGLVALDNTLDSSSTPPQPPP